jgi:fumarate reductase flavoprotein subunit
METLGTFDLVVVGAGVAGWTAARRAQQLGLRVVIAEKFKSGPGFGNGRMSGGVFHAAYLDPLRPPGDLLRMINSATTGAARPDVARAWADNCGRAIRFLESQGAQYAPRGEREWNRHTLLPFGADLPETPLEARWRGAGPDQLLTSMWLSFVRDGGDFRGDTRALELITEAEEVIGVRTTLGDILGESVLLADGGFHSNKTLGKRYYGSDGYLIRASHQNTGDGLEMALGVGAATADLHEFYGHLQHRGAMQDYRLWPSPSLDHLAEGGLLVTASGARLGNTGATFMHLVSEVIQSESPLGCWVVVDQTGWQALGSLVGRLSPAATLDRLHAEIVVADSVEDLASRLGMSGDALQRAVDAHNQHCLEPSSLPPSGEGLHHSPVTPERIQTPPLRAFPVVVGITFGLGGILVNGDAQVLDSTNRAIPGLYAAGNSMGGLQGGPDHGYAGGWAQASVFGLVAAEHAARRLAT